MSLIGLIPTTTISFLVGRLAHLRLPQWVLVPIIRLYSFFYRVDLSAITSFSTFKSFAEFFSRPFLEGSRPIDQGIVSPCDGTLYLNAEVRGDRSLQVKACNGSLSELFGEECNGEFDLLGIYLSPSDYHRVYSPLAGELELVRHIPGRLLPVGPTFQKLAPRLYLENERLVFRISYHGKPAYLLMVGAMNVGQMNLSLEGFSLSRDGSELSIGSYDLSPGQELASFSLGSTVLLAIPKPLSETCASFGSLKMGQQIAKSRP